MNEITRIGTLERSWMETRARAAGFDLVSLAAVENSSSSRFAQWIAAGYAGEMEWLKRTDDDGGLVRGDLRRSIPWARSVLVCAANYNAEAPRSIDHASETAGWIARYAWSGEMSSSMGEPGRGTDYHDTLLEKLRVVEAEIRERFSAAETRCYVDTGPLLERDFAARAGIGWIGKNTCVLNEQMGSWLLLGVVVTSLELLSEAASLPAADRCGTCTRCIDACPTDALLLPTPEDPTRKMDATRCIAYLTIEKKGAIDETLRASMGRHVFGCDICQDVCPWNRRSPVSVGHSVRRELINPELDWLADLDGPAFNRWFRGSPLERTRRRRVLRNVAIAMGNSGHAGFIPRLQEWEDGDDEVLAESAHWALRKLARKNSPPDSDAPAASAS